MFLLSFVCLFETLCKNFQTDSHDTFSEGWQWANKQWLNFGGNPDHHLDTEIVFQIRHYWEIRKMEP